MYETDELLAQYLLLHYGKKEDVLPWTFGPFAALDYPARCVSELVDRKRLTPGSTALDLGCAVGRSSFELSKICDAVKGIDLSRRFIEISQDLARHGTITFPCPIEGAIRKELTFHVPKGARGDRISFEIGDAGALPHQLGTFDVVLNANLVDRLADPKTFLHQLHRYVAPGGQLILSSPFTWLNSFTAHDQWLGGYMKEGTSRWTWDEICRILQDEFSLVFDTDLPFLIREHARKYQWSVAHAGRWIRR